MTYGLEDSAKQVLSKMLAAFNCARRYERGHPRLSEAVNRLRYSIELHTNEEDPLVFDFIYGRIYFHRDPIIEDNPTYRELIDAIELSEGNSLIIRSSVDSDDLQSLLLLLKSDGRRAANKGIGLSRRLRSAGVRSLRVKRTPAEPAAGSVDIAADNIYGTKLDIYDRALGDLSRLFLDASRKTELGHNRPEYIVKWICKTVRESPEKALAWTALNIHEDYLPSHSLNVAILSTALGRQAGLGGRELERLAMAAVLHDIGKIRVPAGILNKKKTLTAGEWIEIKNHVSYGVEILAAQDNIDKAALTVAYEHHLGLDLSGYPSVSGDFRQHIYSRIVQIADTYEGLTSIRSYHPAKIPSEAISLMLGPLAHAFDTVLLKLFIRLMGVYPIGSLIRISTDNIGVVRSYEGSSLLRPIVELLDLPEPRLIELASRPDIEILGFVDPLSENIDFSRTPGAGKPPP